MNTTDTIYMAEIWELALKNLEKVFIKPLFDTWIKSTIPLSLTETTIEIGTPKQFVKEWLETRYVPVIKTAVAAAAQRPMEVIFTNMDVASDNSEQSIDIPAISLPADCRAPVPSFPETSVPTINNLEEVKTSLLTAKPKPLETINIPANIAPSPPSPPRPAIVQQPVYNNHPPDINTVLNPKYVFSSFVIGNSNRFAHAASLAVAESPAEVYNPFFIYGGVGLGKTHLMHAIGHRIKETNPNMKVVYISSEKFTNELINSFRDNNTESFRQRYRNIDVLLVDDIQFLSNKERTQEEFFHTFNTLHEANKQIIISSDRAPREIQTLEDRLRSRFEWGLITDIQAPDLETRIAILRKKAMLENLNIPNEVMVYIATRIDNNIRELEGALIRVIAYASLHNHAIDIDITNDALKDIFPNGGLKQITTDLIKEIVASHFKIKLEELAAKKRTRNITYPRQIAMYLCRELTENSLPKIGEIFGGRDHTTVIHAHDKISRERNDDAKLNQTIKELVKKIES